MGKAGSFGRDHFFFGCGCFFLDFFLETKRRGGSGLGDFLLGGTFLVSFCGTYPCSHGSGKLLRFSRKPILEGHIFHFQLWEERRKDSRDTLRESNIAGWKMGPLKMYFL